MENAEVFDILLLLDLKLYTQLPVIHGRILIFFPGRFRGKLKFPGVGLTDEAYFRKFYNVNLGHLEFQDTPTPF